MSIMKYEWRKKFPIDPARGGKEPETMAAKERPAPPNLQEMANNRQKLPFKDKKSDDLSESGQAAALGAG